MEEKTSSGGISSEISKRKVSRKQFLKFAAVTAAGAAGVGLIDSKKVFAEGGESLSKPEADLSKLPRDVISKNELLRMQEDLGRALSKPRSKRKWTMVLDLRRCIGCHSCTIACKAENVTPPGVAYRRVLDIETGIYPDVKRSFVPVLCNQCEKPSCVPVCPVDATNKRPDGIVDINYNQCIGCRACLNGCPYGARSSDFGQFYTKDTPKLQDYESRPTYEYKKEWPRVKGKSPIGNARKCHFCIHRIERGLLPACVVTCIGVATFFGDRDDKSGLIAELINKNKVSVLKEGLGLKPQIYYIGLEGVQL